MKSLKLFGLSKLKKKKRFSTTITITLPCVHQIHTFLLMCSSMCSCPWRKYRCWNSVSSLSGFTRPLCSMFTTLRKPSKRTYGTFNKLEIMQTQCMSLRTEKYSHMLSCRTKLAILLCLKYFGRTSLAKRPWSKTWKLVPDWKRLVFLNFCPNFTVFKHIVSRMEFYPQICLVSQLFNFDKNNRIKTLTKLVDIV